MLLLHALRSGCPYPCSRSTLHFLSGVGFHLWSHCRSHCLLENPADSLISSRQFSHIASYSSWLTPVLPRSIAFYDDVYCSTYTSLPLYLSFTLILCNTRYLVTSKPYLESLHTFAQRNPSPALSVPKDIASLREHLPLTRSNKAAP